VADVWLAYVVTRLQETAAAAQGLTEDERQAQRAAAVATATVVLSEASASALKDVIAEEGISQEQQAESIAAAREQRMQQLLYAITVLASSSGEGPGSSVEGRVVTTLLRVE
jgi:uncharacterized membrane protein YqiK